VTLSIVRTNLSGLGGTNAFTLIKKKEGKDEGGPTLFRRSGNERPTSFLKKQDQSEGPTLSSPSRRRERGGPFRKTKKEQKGKKGMIQ